LLGRDRPDEAGELAGAGDDDLLLRLASAGHTVASVGRRVAGSAKSARSPFRRDRVGGARARSRPSGVGARARRPRPAGDGRDCCRPW
jgi:hypothetical protein